MRIIWSSKGWNDYLYWQSQDKKTLKRINAIIRDVERTPYEGIGKPEPLKHEYHGWWSRRIDSVNRFVYKINDGDILIAQCKTHYSE